MSDTTVNTRESRVGAWPIVAILAVATFVRLVGITFGLPHPQCRPDETTIVAVVNRFYGGDLNPGFFNYPSFFMLVLFALLLAWLRLGELLGYVKGRAGMDALLTGPTINQAARYLSAAAGVASVWATYRVARELFDRTTAHVAALFLALAFLHVRDSHFGVTDVAATFLAMVAFLFAVRLARTGRLRDLTASAVAAGLATSTKYNLALIALPALLSILATRHAGPTPVTGRLGRAALFAVVMAAVFVLGSPYVVLEYREAIAAVQLESRHLATGHGVIFTRGWVFHATSTLRYGLGLPMFVAALAGIVLLLARDGRTGALVALFPVAYYLVLGSGYTVFARYMIPVVPFLCLSAGYAVVEGARAAVARVGRPAWSPAAVWLSALLVVSPSAWSVARFDKLLSVTDNRLRAAAWIEKRFPGGAAIAQVGPEGGRVFVGAGHPRTEARYPSFEWTPTSPEADVIVVQSSPLFPNADNRSAIAAFADRYALAADLQAAASDPANVYDWQDEFYLPLTGFKGVTRAGPNLQIYVRR